MIQAILDNKTKFLTQAYREGVHKFEDPLTSIIFEPLRYIPPHESFSFFSHFFEETDPLFTAEKINLHFWKRLVRGGNWVEKKKWDHLKKTTALERSVEPDLVIEYSNQAGKKKYYLIEVKWNSTEGKKEQLLKQWEVLRNEIQKSTIHIFLVKQKPSSCSRKDVTIRLWDRFVAELNSFPKDNIGQHLSPQFENWQCQTVQFLQKVDEQCHQFSGFSNVGKVNVISNWKYMSFDNSVIQSFYNSKCNRRSPMASENGTNIKNAAETIISVYQEIYALEREITAILEESMTESTKIVSRDFCTDEPADAVYVKYLWQYELTKKGKKGRGKNLYYVTYLLTLLEDQEAYPGMDEPTLHVAITKDDDVEFDFFDWQGDPEVGEEGDFELCYDNKVHIWADGSLFATPLTAIENRKDIENQLVNPAVDLIKNYWDKIEESCVKDTFAKSDQLYTFEKFKNGVRKKG
ncbi:hypothetical protein [Vibrio sp.]|uniref:hypothetical protein n=1 Tax=Vibrio sp. TaxID=678 RepID=UPI003D0C1419